MLVHELPPTVSPVKVHPGPDLSRKTSSTHSCLLVSNSNISNKADPTHPPYHVSSFNTTQCCHYLPRVRFRQYADIMRVYFFLKCG